MFDIFKPVNMSTAVIKSMYQFMRNHSVHMGLVANVVLTQNNLQKRHRQLFHQVSTPPSLLRDPLPNTYSIQTLQIIIFQHQQPHQCTNNASSILLNTFHVPCIHDFNSDISTDTFFHKGIKHKITCGRLEGHRMAWFGKVP